ncbi:MAG: bifunctional YncE family protein/alkaline phosphatase family protein [Candidatus Eremiobacteraeota bacterium]|nr:bifunctional YncE family protein/alkaline phosphatase family protein [Candidatus Eremiobacteraeota bacterium]
MLFVALMGATPTVFSAPAGDRPAGADVLPSGRLLAPTGVSVPVGMNSLGVALSPDGRYAIVTNDDEREGSAVNARDPRVVGGYSLAVVDTKTMRVTDIYVAAKKETFFVGISSLSDPANPTQTIVIASEGPSNAVRIFTLSAAGKLAADGAPIAMPLASDPHYANNGHAFPSSIQLSQDRKRAYVVNNLANTVTAIDLVNRRVLTTNSVGFFPYGIALSGYRLFVTDEGLMKYGVLPNALRAPQFSNVAADAQSASALSAISLGSNGDLEAQTPASSLSLDPAIDGETTVGGAHPSAIVTTPGGAYAYVAMTNVDRIATVALSGTPSVVGGLQLRLFDRAPYGTQPDAMALTSNGKILYVALAGINAVAVIDARNPAKLHRIGLIPTGWYPTALALSANNRYLYIANAKGYGQDPHFEGGVPFATSSSGRIEEVELDSNDIWATLERVDLQKLPFAKTTLSALRYLRRATVAKPNAIVPPLRSLAPSGRIKHVVFILEENKTYDSMLGDLTDEKGSPYGNGDPSLVSFGQSITPNLHELAKEFGLAVNEYADAEDSDAGHQFASAGITSAYSEKTLLVKTGRYPLVNKNEDPEDYPRAGYIFNSLMHEGRSYRDYGDLIRLSGYDEGRAADVRADDPPYRNVDDDTAPTSGFGGLYSLDVPALLALRDHVDPNYPGWNLRIRDVRRAKEFIKDYDALEKSGNAPAFTYIWLPADHGGHGENIPPLPEEVADGDRALGMIVDHLSHLPEWNSTAIFITPDDAQSTRDHVNEHRSYAIVVSPYAKRQYLGRHHISTVSILKTEEELLALPPLSLGDLLATDMSDFFTANADARPYSSIAVPVQSASTEGARIAKLLEGTDQSGPDADVKRSAALIGLSREADRLAARRTLVDATKYAQAQAQLYGAALQVLHGKR